MSTVKRTKNTTQLNNTGLTRRSFLAAVGTSVAGLAMQPISVAAEKDIRPNILFIMVDDLGKEWISCYGAEDIETPQCTPSRATLLTGQYPWRTGWVNHWDVPRWGVGYFDWKLRRNMTFARILKTAGYATAAVGKWQINDFRVMPDAMKKHGFDDWCMWTGYETGNKASAKRYWDAYVNTPQSSKTHAGKFGPDVYTDYLIRFMSEHKDEPMMLYFPMALTHGPLTTTPAEPNVENSHEKFKAMVRYTDLLVGRLCKALNKLRIRNRTIIIFTTDNGSGGGHTGTLKGRKIRGGKGKKTENGVCAPFIVNCPGLVPRGVVTDALTDFTDLLPTFAELSGAKVPRDLKIDGVSIAPLLLGKAKDSGRKWIMALGLGAARLDEKGVRGKVDYTERVIRNKQYKVWVSEQQEISQLYDLLSDPFEQKNLIESTKPEHLAAIEKFQVVVDTMPEKDARPGYKPREANPWEKKLPSKT